MNPRTLLLFLAVSVCLRAAPLVRDLGAGLIYVRVHRVPADLPSPGSAAGKCVVMDIRFVSGGTRDGAALVEWLRARSSLRRPVFLLANLQTGDDLLRPLDSPTAVAGLVILGPKAPGFSPDIALAVPPETDRRAYRALERGATVESLVNDTPVKARQDEAMLAREHLPDSAIGGPDDNPEEAPAPKSAGPAPLIDAVLQRAIQLHRTLLALRRID